MLGLAILEIAMRLSGIMLLSLQEHKNLVSLRQIGAYRIMCLGESTTANFLGQKSYPSQLEEILNQRNIGLRFSVINKGIIATNTTFILSQLEANLDSYKPNMVIAMMGINDCGYAPNDNAQLSKSKNFFESLKVYKLLKTLWSSAVTELKAVKDELSFNLSAIGPRKCYAGQDKDIQDEDSLKQSIRMDPQNDALYINLGIFYREQGKYFNAENSFRQAIKLNPGNCDIYFNLGLMHEEQGNLIQAEESYIKAMGLGSRDQAAYAYRRLGELYEKKGDYPGSEESYKKSLELNPKNDDACERLGFFYRNRGNFPDAEKAYKKALELNPYHYFACRELGRTYEMQRKYKQAEELFRKFMELNPGNDRISQDLIQLYEEMDKSAPAQGYSEKASILRSRCYDEITGHNYLELKRILDKKMIKLVCVQYPARSIKPLKKIFQGHEGIIFVDNEKIFRDAIKKCSYEEYFIDKMFVDFGHCTSKGNRLLAENIANAILKEVFNK